MTQVEFARITDISCVRADITKSELREMVELAKKYRFICCFAMPCYTEWLINELSGESDIIVGGTAGFPSGADLTEVKALTAKRLAALGCREIDMVINVSALKSGDNALVSDDIKAVVRAAGGLPVKLILEAAYLTDDELKRACELGVEAGVAFLKTGTGWAGKPATAELIRRMRLYSGGAVKLKAAGGIRKLAEVEEMREAGCDRFGIGVASVRKILSELE